MTDEERLEGLPAQSDEEPSSETEQVEEELKTARRGSALLDILLKGSTLSDPIEIADGVSVVFRSLMPKDYLAIEQQAARFQGLEAQITARQLFKLSRALKKLGNGPLELEPDDEEALQRRLGKTTLTQYDHAAEVLRTQCAPEVLDLLEAAYDHFHRETHGDPVDELKKKFLGLLDSG